MYFSVSVYFPRSPSVIGIENEVRITLQLRYCDWCKTNDWTVVT